MVKSLYISSFDRNFPNCLREIPSSPAGIYCRGNSDLLASDQIKIAIVGTRRASPLGLSIAYDFASELASHGIIIVSGLAFGIDQAGHRGCLEAQGQTIAVLANDVADIYPRQHLSLAQKIIDLGGAIISEYAPGAQSLPHHFLERNRLISGFSQAVIIIECPQQSGALNTAAHALEQNKDIFVVPGAINSPNYIGSNNLIKQGACLINSAQDVLDHYGISRSPKSLKSSSQLTSEQKAIIDSMRASASSLTIDKICELTHLEPQVINQEITALLLDDLVSEHQGKYFLK